MDEFERLRLKVRCLEVAKEVAIAQLSAYSIDTLAQTYWQWLTNESTPTPTSKSDDSDDIPF